jgi:murein DD-endopeptidase MepM/ murein hydrolase activator NlpD
LVPHKAVDLCAPRGTPIIAPLSGEVTRRGVSEHGGNNFMIRHGSGLVTYYAHADEVYVSVGQRVRQHEIVATVGSSGVTSLGRSMDPHLHLQVQASEDFSSEHYDPVAFLDALGIRKDGLLFYWKDGYPRSAGISPLLAFALGAGAVVGSVWLVREVM